jgi:hypothetical protein
MLYAETRGFDRGVQLVNPETEMYTCIKDFVSWFWSYLYHLSRTEISTILISGLLAIRTTNVRVFMGLTYPSRFRTARPLTWAGESHKGFLAFAAQITCNSNNKLLEIQIRLSSIHCEVY